MLAVLAHCECLIFVIVAQNYAKNRVVWQKRREKAACFAEK